MAEGWGWNPATFEALGTVGASIAAVMALVMSLRQVRSQRAEEQRRHARAVYVTWANSQRAIDWTGFELSLTNGSGVRIRPVCMIVKVDSRTYKTIEKYSGAVFQDCVATSMNGSLFWKPAEYKFVRRAWTSTVEAGQSATFDVETMVPFRTLGVRIEGQRNSYNRGGGIGLTFRDPDGIEWTRRADGRLIRGRGLTPREVRRSAKADYGDWF